MKYLSICSGIEAASAAWHQFGWQPIAFAEIEPFPSAVLAHHYPNVPNLGDMTRLPEMILRGEVEAPDLLVGGTPCQAFSVAGLRNSLDDNRGQLSLTFIRIADAIDHVRRARGEPPCIIVWENVPGVLSTSDNAFGCFLGALAGEDGQLEPSGKRWTNAGAVFGPERTIVWRILDAQYFGVAQRRRRVFVVASARDGFDPAQVLFEFDGVRRDSPPSREARKVAPTIPGRSTEGGGLGTDFDCDGGVIAHAFKVRGGCEGGGKGYLGSDEVAFTLSTLQDQTIHCFDRQQIGGYGNGPVASTLAARDYKDPTDLVAQTYSTPAIGHIVQDDVASTITKNTGAGGETQNPAFVAQPIAIQNVRAVEKSQNGKGWNDDGTAYTVDTHATQGVAQPIGFNTRQDPDAWQDRTGPVDTHYGTQGVAQPVAPALTASNDPSRSPQSSEVTQQVGAVYQAAMQVRRLTPVECERLQGFPDGWTDIPWRGKPNAPDGPRYKALGNSMAVPCMAWIGNRINQHDVLH